MALYIWYTMIISHALRPPGHCTYQTLWLVERMLLHTHDTDNKNTDMLHGGRRPASLEPLDP